MKLSERQDRVRELRRYGTSEDAENAALEVVAALPEDATMVGIFASFDDVDNDESGTGGIHFQCVGDNSVAVVGIHPTGVFEDCHAVRGDEYVEFTPASAVEAANWLTR